MVASYIMVERKYTKGPKKKTESERSEVKYYLMQEHNQQEAILSLLSETESKRFHTHCQYQLFLRGQAEKKDTGSEI